METEFPGGPNSQILRDCLVPCLGVPGAPRPSWLSAGGPSSLLSSLQLFACAFSICMGKDKNWIRFGATRIVNVLGSILGPLIAKAPISASLQRPEVAGARGGTEHFQGHPQEGCPSP